MIKKCFFFVVGYGMRFLLIIKIIFKEMLFIVDKFLI